MLPPADILKTTQNKETKNIALITESLFKSGRYIENIYKYI